jgi:hypothetical protein
VLLAAATALWTAFMSGSPIGRHGSSYDLLESSGRDNAEPPHLDLYLWHSLPQLLCSGNCSPQNLRSLLSARFGLCIPFVNVRGGGTVDQEAEQFRPAVVTSGVHHMLPLVNQREIEFSDDRALTRPDGFA